MSNSKVPLLPIAEDLITGCDYLCNYLRRTKLSDELFNDTLSMIGIMLIKGYTDDMYLLLLRHTIIKQEQLVTQARILTNEQKYVVSIIVDRLGHLM